MTSVIDTSTIIVGQSGAGKTVTAKHRVDELLEQRRHTIIIDPTGVWWGMRATPDGKPGGFDLPIFGGEHGDVPIRADQGAAIARIIVEQRVSAIVDLSSIDNSADWRLFMEDFVAELRKKPKALLHLVVDEADEFAAERVADDVGFRLRENMVWIAKRGRVRGFIPTYITQRTAEIAKAVISQAQTVIVHQLILPADQKAIDDYLKGNGSAETRKAVMSSLAELAVGERWLYSPRLKLLERGMTPPLTTFDSSRTPEAGEQVIEPRTLSQLDVSAIAAALASKAGAELPDDAIPADPAAAYATGGAIGAVIVERDQRIVELEATVRDQAAELEHLRAVDAECESYNAGLTAIEELVLAVRSGAWRSDPQPARSSLGTKAARAPGTASTPAPQAPALEDAPPSSSDVAARRGASDRSLGAERKPLAVLAGYAPAAVTDAQWATLAGFKRTGGTWSTYRSRLRTAGLIEQADGKWRATDAGVAAIGADVVTPPPPGRALVEFWADRVPGVGKMMRKLAQLYPTAVKRDALAIDLGMAAGGGTFGTYLSRLRANGLLEEKGGRIRLHPTLMSTEQ